MKLLEPNDPLWKLLGKGRDFSVRPGFVRDVVREARNTQQEQGWWSALRTWWMEKESPLPMGRLIAVAAVVAVIGWLSLAQMGVKRFAPVEVVAITQTSWQAVEDETVDAEVAWLEDMEDSLEDLDHLDALLAMEDVSALTDSEIAYLLY